MDEISELLGRHWKKRNLIGFSFYDWATMPWDLDRNGKCDIRDIAIASYAYGSTWSTRKWNPIADLNNDGIVDIKDIGRISVKFGWTDP